MIYTPKRENDEMYDNIQATMRVYHVSSKGFSNKAKHHFPPNINDDDEQISVADMPVTLPLPPTGPAPT